ncbi:MAG TPA: hypothetical protein VGD91_26670 [Trebonia sp.]
MTFVMYPGPAVKPVSDQLAGGFVAVPDFSGALGQGEVSSFSALPQPITTATAASEAPRHKRPPVKPAPTDTATAAAVPAASPAAPASGSSGPLAGGSYAGSLVLNASGAQLAAWNQTSSYCPQTSWQVSDGTVKTDSGGDVALGTTGTTGSCVALVSPGAYSSNVIEASIDFPALPGKSGTIADWTSFWLTDGATWPMDGELDAVEAQPVNGQNAVSWHSGTTSSPFTASTNGWASGGTMPVEGANVTAGWHTVDIVYTKGFFAVYYDGHQYTSYTSDNVTGSPLNIYITTSVTPDNGTIQSELGGPPQNSDSSPATYAVKDLKVWSFK